MDGVLIDSEPIHITIERKLFDKLGIAVSAEVHRTYLGTAGDYMYNDVKERYGLAQSVTELLEFDELFRVEYFKSLEKMELNDGIPGFLNELRSSGIKLAVATSSSPLLARTILERCGIFSFFDAVVTTSEAGKSKPSPDVYLLAAHRIGIDPDNCLVFEDSPNGLSAAKNAGMYCVAIETSSVNVIELTKADYVIQSFTGMTVSRMEEIYSLKNQSN